MCATVYGWHHLVKATEVTAGLAESNGSLQRGGWLSHLRLTACTPGSALFAKAGISWRRHGDGHRLRLVKHGYSLYVRHTLFPRGMSVPVSVCRRGILA